MKRLAFILLILIVGCQTQDSIRFGVIADIHGDIGSLGSILEEFSSMGINKMIVAGDLADLRNEIDDTDEIIEALDLIKDIGTVFVIPGNHDLQKNYESAISDLDSDEIIDMSKQRSALIGDIQLVSNPYGSDFTYIDYKKEDEELKEVLNYIDENKFNILITHQPPKGCVDLAGDKNVGSEALDNISSKFEVIVSGHIHESANACSDKGFVEEGNWVSEIRYNPGSVIPWTLNNGETTKGMAGIIEVKGNNVRYISVKN